MTDPVQTYPPRDKWIEILAVLLNLAYTGFYLLEWKWCFAFAFVGSALFVLLCFQRKIYAESLLQLFYVFMAVYGWKTWGSEYVAVDWNLSTHLLILGVGLLSWLVSAVTLKNFSDSKMPFVDTFTTIFSVLATWLMVNLEPNNWWYWLVINVVSIFLYLRRGMKFGAIMFVIYWLMAVFGIIKEFFLS